MESVTSEWFWFWVGLLMLDILARLVTRVLAVSSFSVRTCRDHHIMPVTQLFREVAVAAIEHSSTLDILRHCGLREFEDLPSWVPDWSK